MGMADLHVRPAGEFIDIGTGADAALARPIRGLYVGVSGDVAIVDMMDNDITLEGLAAGVIHPIACKQVKATGTTATGILGVVR